MADAAKIHILGIGDDGLEGLTSAARQLIEQAELLIGAEHTLARLPKLRAERMVVGGNLDSVVERLSHAKGKRAAVLASGDPLFYGMARYLCDKLGKERFEVMPHFVLGGYLQVIEDW